MARFPTGLAVGLVVGAALGVGGVEGWRALHADPWIVAGGDWVRLPSQEHVGALPQTFTVPAKAWDYGAMTRALPATVTARPALVRVDLEKVSGVVGVSLAKPDGSALISKERTLPAGPGPVSAYFRASGAEPIAILLRNYGAEGKAGAVEVKAVRYAPESTLPSKALSEANKAGVG